MWSEWKTKSLREIAVHHVGGWWRSLDRPDPWPHELDDAVHARDAIPVCHRCSTPCDSPVWFCPACGAAVGPYNNLMPYIRIFSIGEALRSGVGPGAHFTPFRAIAYVTLGLVEYAAFAPLYFFRLYRNYRRLKGEQTDA